MIANLEELISKASPGNWLTRPELDSDDNVTGWAIIAWPHIVGEVFSKEDADLICSVHELAEEVIRLRALVARLTRTVNCSETDAAAAAVPIEHTTAKFNNQPLQVANQVKFILARRFEESP